MFIVWWRSVLNLLNRKPTSRRRRRRFDARRSTYRIWFEPLEDRLAPAAHIWTGNAGAGFPQWSNGSNWNSAIGSTETAITFTFPSVTNKTAQDDIPGLMVDQVLFTSSGYTISGNGSATLVLSGATGDNIFSNSTGINKIDSSLPLLLTGGNRFDVAAGGTLSVGSVIGDGGSAGSLTQTTGAGSLVLQGANTFTGAVTVNAGSLILSGGGTATTVSGFTVNQGGILTLDNSSSNANRIGDSTAVTLAGGEFKLIGNSAGSTETFGTLSLHPELQPSL